jgi:hypothetical protein
MLRTEKKEHGVINTIWPQAVAKLPWNLMSII